MTLDFSQRQVGRWGRGCLLLLNTTIAICLGPDRLLATNSTLVSWYIRWNVTLKFTWIYLCHTWKFQGFTIDGKSTLCSIHLKDFFEGPLKLKRDSSAINRTCVLGMHLNISNEWIYHWCDPFPVLGNKRIMTFRSQGPLKSIILNLWYYPCLVLWCCSYPINWIISITKDMAKLPSDVPTVLIPGSFSKIKTPQTMEWYGINILHNRHPNDYDCWFEMIYTYFWYPSCIRLMHTAASQTEAMLENHCSLPCISTWTFLSNPNPRIKKIGIKIKLFICLQGTGHWCRESNYLGVWCV